MKKVKVYFQTGTMFLKGFTLETYAENKRQLDVLSLLDDNAELLKRECQTFRLNELLQDYTETEIDEMFLAVNGGEFYVHTIDRIDFVK